MKGFPFHALLSQLFSLLPLFCFLLDMVLDTMAVASFYQNEEYVFMGLLILLLISSSVLLQIFSWLWYSDPSGTRIEAYVQRLGLLGAIHVLQLGIFLRFAGLLESSIRSFKPNVPSKTGIATCRHDLSTLRLFEAFSENAPQVVLILTNIIQTEKLHIPVVKLFVSLSALAFTMLSYHRNMRTFIPETVRMGFFSSIIYFLWNLLLIGPRVVCLSLFASILPCYVTIHFLSWWMLLVFWAWRQKTNFMDSPAGEWLYRATVGLIWYFSWFNVASGRTKIKAMLYHVTMGTDTMLLLGLWWWRRSAESARLGPIPVNRYVLIITLILIYISGLVLKEVYYWKCHNKKISVQIDVRHEGPTTDPEGTPRCPAISYLLETDSTEKSQSGSEPVALAPSQEQTGIHKRMRNMAVNFYC